MKTLELSKMETVEGGGYVDGFCGATSLIGGAWGIAAAIGVATMGVGAAVGLGVVGIACGAYAVFGLETKVDEMEMVASRDVL